VAVIGELKLYVPLEGVIDPETEIARLTKELAKLDKDLDSVTKKLGNEAFLSKANPEAIQKQKNRHFELSSKKAGLTESLEKMLKFRTS
jgi:valyl-tRNA synthetase